VTGKVDNIHIKIWKQTVRNYFLINNTTLHLYSSRALAFLARVHNKLDDVYHTVKSLIYVGNL